MSTSPWVADHNHPMSEINSTGVEIMREGVTVSQINDKLAAGKAVRLGQGTFNIDDPIIIPSYSDFRCAGKIRTTIKATQAMTHMVKSSTVDTPGSTVHINLSDFTLDGNNFATKGVEIGTPSLGYGSSEIRLVNMRVLNCINGVIFNGAGYSSASDLLIIGVPSDTSESFGIQFAYGTNTFPAFNVIVAGFKYNWDIYHFGVHAIRCASYTESTHVNTANLLRIHDGYFNIFDGCTFEHLAATAINEVLLDSTVGGLFACTDNKFVNCLWHGTGGNSTRMAIGVNGHSSVNCTTVENGRFLDLGGAANINLVNQAYTNLLRNKRVIGYSGNIPYDLVLAGQDIAATGGKQIKFNE